MLRVTVSLSLLLYLTACGSQGPQQLAQQLRAAVVAGDLAQTQKLIALDANPNIPDSCGITPLMLAARSGSPELVSALLAAGAEVNAMDKGGYTALMQAAGQGDPESLQRLIDAGANVNQQERTRGWSALAWAASTGKNQNVLHLLKAGADPRLRDASGLSAADLATGNDHPETARLIKR